MARPRITENPEPLHITVDAQTLETLRLIGLASPLGVPARAAMVRLALDEFIRNRMEDPAIRAFVEAHRSEPVVRLIASDERAPQKHSKR